MGEICSKREGKCKINTFWSENLKGIDHFEDLEVDKRITLHYRNTI
jgi:hypothetical protein